MSMEKFRTVVESIKDIPYVADAEARLTFLGTQASRLGIDPEEAVGKALLTYIAPEDRDRVAEEVQRSLTTADETPTEFRLMGSDGRQYWFEARGSVLRDESGTVSGFSGSLRDITEQRRAAKALRESEETARALLNATRDSAILIEPEGLVIDVNEGPLRAPRTRSTSSSPIRPCPA
jgi:PAS domain S-box-containing protein